MRFFPPKLLAAAASAAALAAVASAVAVPPATASSRSCGKTGYAYAGHQSSSRAHGVRATLRAVANPAVESGHVAAWIGLGGPGQGPNGSDAWLQIGLSAFPWERGSKLYYEVNKPGSGPVYRELRSHVAPGQRVRVAVLESRQRDWWRVWVDGQPVSEPIHLPGTSKRWRPVATAETWDGGRRSCNRFSYSFENVAVAGGRGGSWRTFHSGHRFQDSGFRVVASSAGAFFARTTLSPPRDAAQASPPQQLQPAASAPAVPPAPAPSPLPEPAPAPLPEPAAALEPEPAPTPDASLASVSAPIPGAETAPPPTEAAGNPVPAGLAEHP